MPLSDLHQSLLSQVEAIAQQLLQKKNEVKRAGLHTGKAGIALLYAYLSKAFPEKKYLQVTLDYLNELNGALVNDELNYNIYNGFTGIAFLFQHLRNMGLLDVADDLCLSDLDDYISQGAENDFQTGMWDPLFGMVGLGIYFLERNTETGETKYLEKIADYLAAMAVTIGEHRVWITPDFTNESAENYNFGMAHGMPGILSFLAQVHGRGIRQPEIEGLLSSSIDFLLKNENPAEAYCCFPKYIYLKPGTVDEPYSRLAWCYGDLCVANALIHCGVSLQNEGWKAKGIEVALKTTLRTFDNSGCEDAFFCHGSVGMVHQYSRLFQFTKNTAFRIAAENWINITQQYFYKPGKGIGGYFYKQFDEEKKNYGFIDSHSLLLGSAGIALVYLSYIFDVTPAWDIIFLTNV
jgi:lantibiotic modifying enzyme